MISVYLLLDLYNLFSLYAVNQIKHLFFAFSLIFDSLLLYLH